MESIKKTNVSEPAADLARSVAEDYAPRKLTLAENVMLTIKILVVAGLIMAAFWGFNQWTSAR